MRNILSASSLRLRRVIAMGGGGRKVIVEPLVTVALLLALYAGWNIMQGRNIEQGLRAAFLDSEATRAEHRRDREALELQAELRQFADTNRQVQDLLEALLHQVPTAARARVSAIHAGENTGVGTVLLRFDVINEASAPNRRGGQRLVNEPLSDWDDFLPALLAGKCQFTPVAQLHVDARRIRMQSEGVASFLACPLVDRHGTLLGDVTLSWEDTDTVPPADMLPALRQAGLGAAAQIGRLLEGQALPAGASAPMPETDH
jgi:hypothetical protein